MEESDRKRPKPRDKYNEEHYQMLLRCSAKKDMAEWNRWREEHKLQEILLEGAELKGAHLKGANLKRAHLEEADLRESCLDDGNLIDAHLEGAYLTGAHLKGAYLYQAHLEGAYLNDAYLESADLTEAYMERAYMRRGNLKGAKLKGSHMAHVDLLQGNLKEANLESAHLEGVDLSDSHLEGAVIVQAHLKDANLSGAHLEGADLMRARLEHTNLLHTHLEDASLKYTHLERAFLVEAHLESAHFEQAIVNGSTLFWHCHVNRHTDFRGVGLDSVRIDPGTKQLLEYNVRRMNWEQWYKQQHWVVRGAVNKFWQISDYGLSTIKIIQTFFKWTLAFALIYYVWGCVDYYLVGIKDHPGIVSDLFVLENKQEAVSAFLVPFRTIYFSVVTMTTLGFGDMYANAHSFWRGLFGNVLLALQVILGYVLLGALVTRFAVLFAAGGPVGTFVGEKKKASSAP